MYTENKKLNLVKQRKDCSVQLRNLDQNAVYICTADRFIQPCMGKHSVGQVTMMLMMMMSIHSMPKRTACTACLWHSFLAPALP